VASSGSGERRKDIWFAYRVSGKVFKECPTRGHILASAIFRPGYSWRPAVHTTTREEARQSCVLPTRPAAAGRWRAGSGWQPVRRNAAM